jgi:hypothetical protein
VALCSLWDRAQKARALSPYRVARPSGINQVKFLILVLGKEEWGQPWVAASFDCDMGWTGMPVLRYIALRGSRG